jgi:SOS-response transcriptional repressor LexA
MARLPEKNLRTREEVYRFIVRYKAEHDGIAPTLREIGSAVGINSTSHLNYLIKTLRTDGRLETIDGQPRTIMVTGGNWELMTQPE